MGSSLSKDTVLTTKEERTEREERSILILKKNILRYRFDELFIPSGNIEEKKKKAGGI